MTPPRDDDGAGPGDGADPDESGDGARPPLQLGRLLLGLGGLVLGVLVLYLGLTLFSGDEDAPAPGPPTTATTATTIEGGATTTLSRTSATR